MKLIKNLSSEAFKPYGDIIDFTEAKYDGWEIIVLSEGPGWRIALLEIDRKSTTTLEHHPKSKESFEPVNGTTLLIAAPYETPDDYEIFLLDRPICLNEKVWHQLICLSDKSSMKITENLEVGCVYHELETVVSVSVS